MKPIYETNYMGFWIRVYSTRVEFKAGAGSESVPLSQIASIHTGMWGYMAITLETTGGRKYNIPCSEKKQVQGAIYQAQEQLSKSQSQSNVSVADELSKLTKLKEQGVLSEKEFDEQKKKLLG